MSIIQIGAALLQGVEAAGAKSHAAQLKRAYAQEARIPAGTKFGIGYRTSFAEDPTPTYTVPPSRIDAATPVSITPGASVQGEQQQMYNLVTKPTPQRATPAQIAQAEPTRMVMQAQEQQGRPLIQRVRRPRRPILRSRARPRVKLRYLMARKRAPARLPLRRTRR